MFQLHSRVPDHRLDEERILALLEAIFAGEGRRLRLSFQIVDDAEMSRIHLISHGDPQTTDVISFDLSGDVPPEAADEDLDGEVVINLEMARRLGAELGHGTEAEFCFYLAHGVLHLLGWDDASDEERAAMHARQRQYLQAVGLDVKD